VPEPFTLHAAIRMLPPGTVLTVESGKAPVVRTELDIVEDLAAVASSPPKVAAGSLAKALDDSVRAHLVADVPVGCFLSAGRDSTALAAAAAKAGTRLHTITLGFAEYEGTSDDEVTLAEAVAARCSAGHTTRRLTGNDLQAARARIFEDMDQPSIDGVNTWLVARAAHETGMKVALSGVGGDELLGGYHYAHLLPQIVFRTSLFARLPRLGALVRSLSEPVARRLGRPKLAGLFELGPRWSTAYLLCRGLFMPWELPNLVGAETARNGLADLALVDRIAAVADRVQRPAAKVAALELSFYMRNQLLRDTDWAAMAHSLEVRTPLVDMGFLTAVLTNAGRGAWPGKPAMLDGVRALLPEALLGRPKTGFRVPVAVRTLVRAPPHPDLRGWAGVVLAAFDSTSAP
jgi:asparagine synthase (glutamine-hydrolysing)